MHPALKHILFKGVGAARFAYTPLADIVGADGAGTGGRYIKNRSVTTPVDDNRYSHSTGLITANGFGGAASVTTRNYANGPKGNLTAMRCQITPAGSQAYVTLLNGITYPAGTHTVAVELMSTAGAGNQTVKFGNFNINGATGLTTCNLTEAGYTKHTHTFTLASPAQIFLVLHRASGDAAVDVLADQIQHHAAATVPDYNTEILGNHLVPLQANGDNIVVTGGLLDNTGDKKPGSIKWTSFPAKTTFTEGAIMASYEIARSDSNYAKIVGASGGTGSWDVGVHAGKAYAAPVILPNSSPALFSNGLNVANKGPSFSISTFNSGKRAFYLNGALIHEVVAATGPFDVREFGFCGDPSPDSGQVNQIGANPFLGKVGTGGVFDKLLTDDEVVAATKILSNRYLSDHGVAMARQNFWIAEGDSITQGFGAHLNTYFKRFVDTLPGNWFAINSATAGARLMTGGANEDLMERLPLTLRRIRTAKAAGHNVVISVMIGANLIPSSADLFAYYDAVREAGARLIPITITPNNSSSFPTFEADRLALNIEIRNYAALYPVPDVALADFGDDPDIGVRTVTTPNAAPNANFQDYVHLNDTGYVPAFNLIDPALISLAVY